MTARFSPLAVVGPQAARAVTELSRIQDRRDQWPYPWAFPPPNATRVTVGLGPEGTAIAPAIPGTPFQVLEYTVRSGFQFLLTDLIQAYLGTAFIPGSSDILWSLDRNSPLGVTIPQGSPVQSFNLVDVPLGFLGLPTAPGLFLPFHLSVPELFQPYDVVRSKAVCTATIPPSAPNYFKSVFLGWLYPATEV